MPLNELLVGPDPARDDVQQTDFGYDVIPRYICNNWQEVAAAQGVGAYPFDAIVIGSGMFGGYCAEKLYRAGGAAAYRVLLLDAGAQSGRRFRVRLVRGGSSVCVAWSLNRFAHIEFFAF